MISAMNLASAFAATAEKNPTKTALCLGEVEYSYGHLLAQTQWLAQELGQRFGVRPGDRVGIWLKNCPEFIPVLFGILSAGGVAVPINNFLKPAEVDFMLADGGIDLLITDASTGEAQAHLLAGRPQLKFLAVQQFFQASIPAEVARPIPGGGRGESDLAVIIYTSGTTGHPKGAMLSHGNLWHNVESCRHVLAAVGSDRFVVLLPMFHSFMLTVGVLLPLLVGGSIVLIKTLHPVKHVIHDIMSHHATILPAVPQFFRTLAHAHVPEDFPLRICISGGAPLPGEILREFAAKLSVPLIEGYGLSEASPVVCLNPLAGPWKAGSIGVPIPDVEVTVQDEAGELLPVGVTGEICVRGGNVMAGYWNQPEATSQALRRGWLLTGDIGHRDADGYFFITDRKKDMLLVNGINVYPREIEEILYQYPGVKEAAVIGLPDPRKGEQPLAFVAPNEGVILIEQELLHFVRARLADYKVPRHAVILTALPRNATGKILKTALRKLAAPAPV